MIRPMGKFRERCREEKMLFLKASKTKKGFPDPWIACDWVSILRSSSGSNAWRVLESGRAELDALVRMKRS